MSLQFIPVQVSGLNSIDVAVESTEWDQQGDPIVKISGSLIPENIQIQSLLHPTDLNLNNTEISDIFQDMHENRFSPFVSASGCFHSFFRPTIEPAEFKTTIKTLTTENNTIRFGENESYNYSYEIRYVDPTSQYNNVFDVVVDTPLTGIRSKAAEPRGAYFWLDASGVIVDADTNELWLNVHHVSAGRGRVGYSLQNNTDGQSGYDFEIKDQAGNYYNFNGDVFDENNIPTLFTTDPHVLMKLPFNDVLPGEDEIEIDYTIKFRYRDAIGDYTSYISFNTLPINVSSRNILTGQNLESFNPTWIEFEDKFLVDSTMTNKKRLSLDISDIALTSNKYKSTGRYESPYYTMDTPIYTMFLTTTDSFPPGIGMDSIKYYVQFGELDPIQISPSNRGNEIIEANGEQNVIPKIMVLDRLENSNQDPLVHQISFEEEIFSFKVIIEFNVENYVKDEFFIPPTIDSYECHVTDRNSFLRI